MPSRADPNLGTKRDAKVLVARGKDRQTNRLILPKRQSSYNPRQANGSLDLGIACRNTDFGSTPLRQPDQHHRADNY